MVLPPDAEEKQNDYVMLSDIFPTGYHATELAGVNSGEPVVIHGAGPVGLMAAATPSFIVSRKLPLKSAPDAYEHFDARESGWTKVVLKPAA